MTRIARTVAPLLAAIFAVAPLGARAAAEIVAEEAVVTMSDGVRLYATIGRPDDGLPHPVIITGTPYGGEPAGAAALAEPYGGDVVAISFHLRGSGASEGVFDIWGPDTRRDAIEMVDWASSSSWSTGSIVTFGGSGLAPWQYAPLDVHHPAVKAAMIATTCIDFYRDCFHPGGSAGAVIEAAGGLIGAGYAQAMEARVRLGLAQNPTPPEQLAGMTSNFTDAMASHTLDSEYWRLRAATEDVPLLLFDGPFDIGGWNGVIEAYLRAQNGFLRLNGGHSAPVQVRERYDGPDQIRFVRRFLLGEDNGFEDEPRVRLYTGLGSRIGWSKGEMLTRGEAEYPFPDTEWTRLYLEGGRTGSAVSLNDGTLAAATGVEGSDVVPVTNTFGPKSEMRLALQIGSIPPLIRKQLNERLPAEVVNLADNALLVSDMRAEEPAALTFTTLPLTRNLEISGEISARLFVSATVPDLDVVVRLTDVWPDGRSEWVTDARLRASMRAVDQSLTRRTSSGDPWRPWLIYDHEQPLEPNEVYELLLHMQNSSNVYQTGHRIRLDVFATGQSAANARPIPGALTLMRGPDHPSSLLLPVIPAGCDRSVVAFDGVAHPGSCASSLAAALA